jgi:3-oxoadipate enol-lactonase
MMNKTRLHVHVVREGQGPVVVLSHALGCDLSMWDGVAERLKSRYTVLRYDHRGHGRSDAPAGPYTIEMLADDAAQVIREHSDEPVHFVGLSMGGMTAQALAAAHPQLLKSVVIANATDFYDEAARAIWQTRIQTVLESGMAAVAQGAMLRWFTPEFRADVSGGGAQVVAQCLEGLEKTNAAAYAASCDAVAHIDFRASNHGIQCPALVIAGMRDESIPFEKMRGIADSIQGSQLCALNTAHLSAAEQPEAFAALLTDFFDSLQNAKSSAPVKVTRLAVAGAGAIGHRHIELIQANPRVRLCAVVDPMPASAGYAAGLGVPHFASLEALFASADTPKPDGVILATPNHLHVAGALLCAQHGVPAIIEKPVADSLASGRELVAGLAKNPVPMLVGHHRRYSSTLKAAKRVIESGELGRVVTIMGSAQFYKPDSYFEQSAWRKQPGGGPILINLIHEMDNLRYLCGELESVHAMASSAVRQFAVEDTAVTTLRFKSGALGTFTLSDTAASPRSWEQTSGENADYPRYPTEDCYFIAGTVGSLAVPTMRSWSYPADGQAPGWVTPFVEKTLALQTADPLAAQLDHFCEVIAGRAAPIITVADALQSLLAVEAVRLSIKSGKTIALHELA